MARVVRPARLLALRGRRDAHARAPHRASRALLACAPRPWLPATGPRGLVEAPPCRDVVCADAGGRSERPRGARLRRARALRYNFSLAGGVCVTGRSGRMANKKKRSGGRRGLPPNTPDALMKPMHIDARPWAAALFDACALALATVAAMYLLEVPAPPAAKLEMLASIFALAIPIQLAVNFAFGIYQGVWRYTSLPDIQRIVFAVLTGTVCVSAALGAAGLDTVFGMREYLLYPLLLVSIMSLARMGFRSFKEWSLYGRGGEQGTPVVILGAGDAAVGLVKELSRSHEWRVVGLLDDDEKKHGRLLHGVRVLGGLEDLARFAQRLKLRHATIAMPSVPYDVRRRVVEVCKRARVSVMTVPTLNNLTGKGAQPARIRKVAVEDLMK